MGFSFFRSILILTIMLVLIAAPACAIKVTVGTRDSSGAASASGEYRLQNPPSWIQISLWVKARFPGYLRLVERARTRLTRRISGTGSSITNTITSDGSFRSTSSDFASGAGAISSSQTSLAGSSGSIGTTSTGKENQMAVAGGFSGQGNMDVSLSSLAAQEALTTGTASAVGTPIFSDELVQGIRGQDLTVSVQGLYLAGEQGLGEFGMVTRNANGGAARKSQKSTEPTYKLAGWKWPNVNTDPNIPILLPTDALPTGFSSDSVYGQISSAQGTWDSSSGKALFSPLVTTTGGTLNNQMDGKNVHLWTNGLSGSTIAMTTTWYTRAKTIPGADGKLYSQAVESDCRYNNNLNWRIETVEGAGSGISIFDIRTIALHELGHTLGLADLYSDSNKDQIEYGYNDGTAKWTLNPTGDVIGLQKLYGA